MNTTHYLIAVDLPDRGPNYSSSSDVLLVAELNIHQKEIDQHCFRVCQIKLVYQYYSQPFAFRYSGICQFMSVRQLFGPQIIK